ncbi:hypothetical protein CO612_10000 [Lysobacteraceae bacterium NML71-0210]|nr:hypothetical protein CO612_10000 [Xanthomonadaceae bacterium NML71-0210]
MQLLRQGLATAQGDALIAAVNSIHGCAQVLFIDSAILTGQSGSMTAKRWQWLRIAQKTHRLRPHARMTSKAMQPWNTSQKLSCWQGLVSGNGVMI